MCYSRSRSVRELQGNGVCFEAVNVCVLPPAFLKARPSIRRAMSTHFSTHRTSSFDVDAVGLAKRFGGVWALRDVSLCIASGEAVALVGPNGAGKSTLLKLLATLWRPTVGTLRLFGQHTRDPSPTVRQRIGYLGHESLLYPQLTLRENLALYGRLYGLSAPSPRVTDLFAQLALDGWGERPIRTLSRGLLQRAALARSLLHEPQLLLLDEPFTGLDAAAAERVAQMLHSLQHKGTTIVLSTHDFHQAEAFCQRVICLDRGRVVYDGPMVTPLQPAYRTWTNSRPQH
ncbi:MAG: hypothetical protein KatS3mg077_0317 [Candidatus Binatia bacterium]|nr:MAG: hypothetical protein KatS3mg077_0317 [Candidatus Binatia bacterium]